MNRRILLLATLASVSVLGGCIAQPLDPEEGTVDSQASSLDPTDLGGGTGTSSNSTTLNQSGATNGTEGTDLPSPAADQSKPSPDPWTGKAATPDGIVVPDPALRSITRTTR